MLDTLNSKQSVSFIVFHVLCDYARLSVMFGQINAQIVAFVTICLHFIIGVSLEESNSEFQFFFILIFYYKATENSVVPQALLTKFTRPKFLAYC